MELDQRGIVIHTWGNVSGIDRDRGLVVIKPSGVAYAALTPEKLVVQGVTKKSPAPRNGFIHSATRIIAGIPKTSARNYGISTTAK